MPEIFERKDNEIPPEEPVGDSSSREGVTVAGPEGRAVSREDIKTRMAGRDAKGREAVRRPVTRTQRSVIAVTWAAIFFAFIYFLFMALAAAAPGYAFKDRLASIFLLAGSLFIFMHGMGYANSMIKASWAYDEVKKRVFSPQREPNVVCLVACFNEPLEVLENTIAAMVAMDYANKEVVILDDSTKEDIRQGVRDLAAKYGASYRQRTNRRGYKAGAINDYLRTTDAPYVGIFDADGLPAHNMLRDLVPIIEENPRLAFVQTPQYYANTDVSNVALAASRQQAVFYEYICEGKSYSRSAFCCGTNVIFRRDALLAIGGFDETSVTEDFMTSLALHVKGYDSSYYNQVYAYSMAPETMASYFTQQSRWAFGSVGGMWKVLKAMITKPGALSLGQWWEYFLSTTYYWVGWVNFTFMCLPMLYIFFGVKPLRADVFTYTLIFIPYIVFTMNMFYSGMGQRGYKLGDMLLGQQIGFLTFPIHMTAAISGIIGLKRPFAVTPKGSGEKLGWLSLWPQLLMLVLSLISFIWGMWRYFGVGSDRNDAAIVINAVWCLYHVVLLSGVFRLNRTLASTKSRGYFESSDGRHVPVTEGATSAPGRISRPPIATPLRSTRPASGRFALVFGLVSLLLMGLAGWSMLAWTLKPDTPVNVYIVDRTTGRDYQEHRGLVWTLNQLKVKKQADFHPAEVTSSAKTYDWASDFYGFIPGDAKNAKPDETRQADLVAGGRNQLLPDKLQAPGVVYLADTYGEFVEYDYGLNKYVKYQSNPRGVTPADVDKIQDFYDRKGLLLAEWNTIGYPTLPGRPADVTITAKGIQAAIVNTQKGLTFMQNVELPSRNKQLQTARASGNAQWQAEMEKQVRDTEMKIESAKNDLVRHKADNEMVSRNGFQLAAQQQLQKMLHVDYQGWYGRYVDKFEEEREYDWRLFKNVGTNQKQNQAFKDLRGPGFVFYKDGPSQVFNPETQKLEDNPFSEPIVITQGELGKKSIEYVSGVYKSTKPEIANDPLLNGVAASSPVHYWFDLVEPTQGATVLAWYKLQLRGSAFAKLKVAGFPARYMKTDANGDGELVFPAAIAYRENGKLRSFYFAGDASDYPLVSRIGEMMPSSSGLMRTAASRFGSYPQMFYWNFYEPFLKNILTENKEIQYSTANAAG